MRAPTLETMPDALLAHTRATDGMHRAAADAGAALARCVRGAAFYDADHPAAVHQRTELEHAIHAWHGSLQGDAIVAAAGNALLLTGLAGGGGSGGGGGGGGGGDGAMRDESVKALCASMVGKSVVGIKLKRPANRKDIDELVRCLGESDKRVRSAGGASRILAERGVSSIELFEMDLEKLMAGGPVDNNGLDDLVAKALSEILLLKQRDDRRGAAIELTLEKVTSPASLGSLLDELIDGAAPGVADTDRPALKNTSAQAKQRISLAGASADDLAEICSQAFGKVTSGNKSPEVLTEAANVLSAALVRLSPQARFKMLEKIAAPGNDDAGVDAVGKAVPSSIIMSAIAQAVMGGARDSQLAIAIGNLLERLRPIERDRQVLLDQLDEGARAGGRPLEGLFLQELNELSQKKSFASLDLPLRETRDSLTQIAKLRQTSPGQPEIVIRTFSSLRPENRFYRQARLLCAMLDTEKAMAAATLTAVRSVLQESAADQSLSSAGNTLLLALWNRAIRDGPQSAAALLLFEIAQSPLGPEWCVGIVHQLRGRTGADNATLLGDFVKAVLAIHHADSFRRRLLEELHTLDRAVLRVLERRIGELSPPGVQLLIFRGGRDSTLAAVALAQTALRAPTVEVKEAALRALAPFPADDTITFLRRAAGLDGDDKSLALLHAQKLTELQLFKLQRAAVEALGATRSKEAVPVLQELLLRNKLVGGAMFDRLRTPAARALEQNGTPEARAVLDDCKRSKIRAVRLACGATS